tara:strand:+ start:49 stop:465 length:417 start_codon:yes stop_codon:yes gene_type:complete
MVFYYSDGNSIRQKVSTLQRQLADLNSRIAKLKDTRSKVSETLKAIDVTQAWCKKAQRRVRYLVRKHDFLTLEYGDHEYWVESSSPVHMNEHGEWDEDSDYYIDAGDRHIHVERDNSHWIDILGVCERIVHDVTKATS